MVERRNCLVVIDPNCRTVAVVERHSARAAPEDGRRGLRASDAPFATGTRRPWRPSSQRRVAPRPRDRVFQAPGRVLMGDAERQSINVRIRVRAARMVVDEVLRGTGAGTNGGGDGRVRHGLKQVVVGLVVANREHGSGAIALGDHTTRHERFVDAPQADLDQLVSGHDLERRILERVEHHLQRASLTVHQHRIRPPVMPGERGGLLLDKTSTRGGCSRSSPPGWKRRPPAGPGQQALEITFSHPITEARRPRRVMHQGQVISRRQRTSGLPAMRVRQVPTGDAANGKHGSRRSCPRGAAGSPADALPTSDIHIAA